MKPKTHMKVRSLVLGLCSAAVSVAWADPDVARAFVSDKVLTIHVPAGATNKVDQLSGMTSSEIVSALTGNSVTNLTKTGRGGIDVQVSFNGYVGSVFIQEGTYIAYNNNALGSNDREVGDTYVFDGATFDNRSVSNWGNNRHVHFRGYGVNNIGALVTSRKVTPTQYSGTWSAYLDMEGDALVADVATDGNNDLYAGGATERLSTFNMNGHTLHVRTRGSRFVLRDSNLMANPGDIVLEGATQLYIEGYRPMAAGSDTTGKKLYVGSEAAVLMKDIRSTPSFWTLVWSNETQTAANGEAAFANYNAWDSSFSPTDVTSRRFWSGAVELLTDMYADTRTMNLTFQNAISGEGGLNVGSTPAAGGSRTSGVVHLRADNTFQGGLNVSNNLLNVWTLGAVPNAGDLRCVDGTVSFKMSSPYSLPDGCFEGACLVENGTGSWRSKIVKEGSGKLDYHSKIGAPLLDLRGGEVEFRDWAMTDAQIANAVSGLIAGRKFFDTFVEATNCLFSSTQVFTNKIQSTVRAANDWNDEMWNADEGGYHTSNWLITYSGYINITNDAPVTWTFLSDVCDYTRLLIDGVEVIRQIGTAAAQKATVTLTPGYHKFNYRIGYGSWKDAGSHGGGPSSAATNVTPPYSGCGFRVDKQGRDTLVMANFVVCNGNEGIVYTWCDPTTERDLIHPITKKSFVDSYAASIGAVSARPGTKLTFDSDPTRHYETFAGFAAVSGANIVIDDTWTISCADLPLDGAVLQSDHAISFGPGAVVRLANPNALRGPAVTYVVAESMVGISGLPTLELAEPSRSSWKLSASQDGKSLRLTRLPPGMVITVR